MQPDKFRDLIPFYVARTLSQPDQREFEARLAVDEVLRHEVEEWRTIAAAVWREADTVARKVPPLSPEIYQRLAYRGSAPQSTYPAASPVEPTLRQPRIRPGRATMVPLTLVAGLVLAFLFGAMLVLLAINANNRPEPINIAQAGTGTPGDGGFGAAPSSTATEVAAVSTDFGIIQASPGVLVPPTDTPAPQPTQAPAVASQEVPATLENMSLIVPTQAVMPVITPAPGECLVINAGSQPVNVYEAARADSSLVVTMIPGGQYRSLVQSMDGWYEVFIAPGNVGWVFAQDVTAAGDCLTLPVASATPMPTSTLFPLQLTIPATAEIAIVTAPFADLRNGPTSAYQVISTVDRNTQFAVRGYFGEGDNRWIFTVLNDGREAWLSALSVQISAVGEITPPPNATQQ